MQVIIISGAWVVFTIVGCCVVKFRNNGEKLKVMSCRHTLRQYQKLDEADRKSMF